MSLRRLARSRRAITAGMDAGSLILLCLLFASVPGCSQRSPARAGSPSSVPPARAASNPATSPAAASVAPAQGASAPIFRLPQDVRPLRELVELEVVPE